MEYQQFKGQFQAKYEKYREWRYVNSETNFQINKEGHLNEINSFATIESISDSKKQIEDIPITGPFSNNDIDDEDQNIIQSPVLSVSNIITNKMNLESVLINENS